MKKYLKKVKSLAVILIVIEIISSVVSIFLPIINANLLTSLTEFNLNKAFKFTILLFVLTIASIITGKYANWFLMKIREILLYNIRFDMLKRMFKLKIRNYDVTTSGEFQERIKSDPMSVVEVFSVVQYSFFSLVKELVILIYIFYLNFYIGLIYLLGVIIIYFYEKIAYKHYEKLDRNNMKCKEENGTILNEILKGIRDIRLLNVKDKVMNIASHSLNKQAKIETDLSNTRVKIVNTTQLMEAFLTCAVILMGIFLIKKDMMTLTAFLIVFMYRSDIFGLILSYTSLKEYTTKYKVAKDRIIELFDIKKFPIEKFGTKSIAGVKGKIEFSEVSFGYNKKEVLHNISFIVNPKENVAIVGKSGSGKSTIFNLLTKSYDNYKGSIKIDDIDIKELDHDTLRNSISIISQNPYIFNLTIKENLKLIDRRVTEHEIIEACKVAKIHDYIETLPQGYDTLVGEGGVNLSGGQKQRLAIARALLKQSKILLFDEATSALDNVTQKEIQEAIDNISKDYTIIIIAHRLSTIINSNKIFILDKGKIIGKGTHQELLKEHKEYKTLYKN